MFPRLRGQETFVSDYFQKHFVSSTNVPPFTRRGNNVSATVFSQQCFSSFAGALKPQRLNHHAQSETDACQSVSRVAAANSVNSYKHLTVIVALELEEHFIIIVLR